ncbi:helix-turn-helix domain-containing protein, partial [Sulfitobacter sp.]|uniref:helix-turn-helix domain-containing protein n=1 Tax=Sulfitobacter sp. TaxID=1903071 RepID=UPI003F6D57DC
TVHSLPAVFQLRNISPRVEEAVGRAMLRLISAPRLSQSMPPQLSEVQKQAMHRKRQIQHLHDKGKTAREIADVIGIDPSLIWREMKQMQIKPNRHVSKRTVLANARREKVVELMDAGLVLDAISRVLEVKEHIIRNDIQAIRKRRKGNA